MPFVNRNIIPPLGEFLLLSTSLRIKPIYWWFINKRMLGFWQGFYQTISLIYFNSQLEAYYTTENSKFWVFSLIALFQRQLSFTYHDQSMYLYNCERIMNNWRYIERGTYTQYLDTFFVRTLCILERMKLCQYTQNWLFTLSIHFNLHHILLAEAASCACVLLKLYSLLLLASKTS